MVILSCVSEAEQAEQADEVRVTPAAREYGFSLISGPERIADGRTSITVAVEREMELLAYMYEEGERERALMVPVEAAEAGIWTLKPAFPKAAEYTITLLGKTAADPSGSLRLLAEWTVEAASAARDSAGAASAGAASAGAADGSAAAPAGGAGTESAPTWFTEYSTLKEYGIEILRAPREREVGAAAEIVVSSEQDIRLSAALWRPGSKRSIGGMTQVENRGKAWYIRVNFPQSGEYRVTISARPRNEASRYYYGAAEWRLHAEVPAGREREAGGEAVAEGSEPGGTAGDTAARRRRERGRDKEALEAELSAAIEDKDITAVRQWLEGCTQGELRSRAAHMQVLKALLFEAAPARSAEARRLLEDADMDPDMVDEKGMPLLFAALLEDRMDAAIWLLERGADVNARSAYGNTVLHLLASPMDNPTERHGKWLALFSEYGIDLDAANRSGKTALSFAALSDRQHAFLVTLVEAGADFDIGDEEGNTPLSHAWQRGAKKNAAYLREKDARMYSYAFPVGNRAEPCRAVLSADLAALGSLPRHAFGGMVARTSMQVPATPLHLAAERGDPAVIGALCARGLEWNVPDRYGRTPLQLALMNGDADTVIRLLDHGAAPHFRSEREATPFVVACATRPEIALRMLEKGVRPEGSAEYRAAIARAAIGSEDIALIRALDEYLDWGYAELAFAADIAAVEIARYLSGRVELSAGDPADFIRLAEANRERDRDFLEQARRPLPAPRRSGGIAGKRGTFPYVLESWSPWLRHDGVELSDYPVGIYVPESYDGTRPFGLVLSMTNAKSSSRYPRRFEKTLDEHELIWIGFDPYNGLHRLGGDANKAFCLAAVYNMLGYYRIDRSRIYIGGYSLGGQLTERVLRTHPWVFDGAFFINISYGGGSTKKAHWNYCKRHLPIVTVEGDYDYNRSWAYKEYDELLCSGYRQLFYLHEPMQGHKLISAASFDHIVRLLEERGQGLGQGHGGKRKGGAYEEP